MAQAWTAEDYFQQSMKSCKNMIVYDRSEDLDEWLEKYPPSKISSADGHGLITITRDQGSDFDPRQDATGLAADSKDSEGNEDSDDIESALACLWKDWEELQKAGQQNSFSEICKLALKHKFMCGTWLFYVKDGAEMDMLWRLLAKEFVHKELSRLATTVRVSPNQTSDYPGPVHMFFVEHSNFTDEDSVFALEKALRRAGISAPMKYKPDIHAFLKIYRSNAHKIRPSIYSSRFLADTRCYSILRMYNVDVKSNPYRHMVTRTTFWNAFYVKYVAQVAEGCQESEDLNRWLDKYVPSSFFQESRTPLDGPTNRVSGGLWRTPVIYPKSDQGWIVLEHEGISDTGQNIKDLRDRWNELRKSGCPIDFSTIKDLARRTGVVSGGWLFHVPSVHKVDILWRTVAEHFASGALKDVATRVLVSPPDPEHSDGDHMILAKNKDFMDEDEVRRLHEALRAAGIKRQLCYRPDVFNCLGLFGENPYGIGPFIYTSRYDVLSRIDTVTPLMMKELP